MVKFAEVSAHALPLALETYAIIGDHDEGILLEFPASRLRG